MLQTRHESGAVFAALEHAYLHDQPGCALVTTGPGLLNAMNGIMAARWEGAKLLVISGATATPQRGRWAAQETSAFTPMWGLSLDRGLFDLALPVNSPEELTAALVRVARGFAQPGRFIAHLTLPTSVQSAPSPPLLLELPRYGLGTPGLDDAVGVLNAGPFAIWVGAGARHARKEVLALAEHTGAMVMSTPRGKGIFPEDHHQYIGVTGLGGHRSVQEALAATPVRRTLVLGSRLGEVSSLWDPTYIPDDGFVQVDRDPQAFNVGFPDAPTLGVIGDIGAVCARLRERLSPRPCAVRERAIFPVAPTPRDGLVRPQALLAAIQRVVVDRTNVVVMSESGSSFAWTNHHLRFHEPRYRVSMSWASMGHMTAGVVGASLDGARALAVVGDAAMMMGNELHMAATNNIRAIWVVLNDGRQGVVAQGLGLLNLEDSDTSFIPVDFVAYARAVGADGVRVTSEDELDDALAAALAATGPFLIDVVIDPEERNPMLSQRVASLKLQGAE